jgi:transposase-like protein
MMGKRRKHSAEFKAKVAIEAIRGEKTASQIASQYEVHTIQVGKWKKEAMEGISSIFQRGNGKNSHGQEDLVGLLYREIGELKVELDWLKKKTGVTS